MRPRARLLLAERLLLGLNALVRQLVSLAWGWFLGLSLIGKGFATAAVLLATAWMTGKLGLGDLARELAGFGWTVLSVVLTVVVIRHLWSHFTRRSRYSAW